MSRISSTGAVAAIFYGVVSIGSTLLTVTNAPHCLPRPHIDPPNSPRDSIPKHSTPAQSKTCPYGSNHPDEDTLNPYSGSTPLMRREVVTYRDTLVTHTDCRDHRPPFIRSGF